VAAGHKMQPGGLQLKAVEVDRFHEISIQNYCFKNKIIKSLINIFSFFKSTETIL
jgi:hypothetical protein